MPAENVDELMVVDDRLQGVDCYLCEANEPHVHTPVKEQNNG